MITNDHKIEQHSIYDNNKVDKGPHGNSESCFELKTKDRIFTFFAKQESDSIINDFFHLIRLMLEFKKECLK